MCLFVLTSSIHELFTPSNYRSLSGSFVGRMQYAPTRVRKCYVIIRSFLSLPESFVGRMQYATTQARKCYAMIRSFRSLSGSFVGRIQYAPTLSDEKRMCKNSFVVLFEAQNRVQILLLCFLRLKMEFKCFCGVF